MSTVGLNYGYFPNADKTWLIVKPDQLHEAERMSADTTIQIIATGSRHLVAAIGCRTFVNQYVQKRVNKWIDEVRCLTSIARTQPHAAFCAYTHGLAGK